MFRKFVFLWLDLETKSWLEKQSQTVCSQPSLLKSVTSKHSKVFSSSLLAEGILPNYLHSSLIMVNVLFILLFWWWLSHCVARTSGTMLNSNQGSRHHFSSGFWWGWCLLCVSGNYPLSSKEFPFYSQFTEVCFFKLWVGVELDQIFFCTLNWSYGVFFSPLIWSYDELYFLMLNSFLWFLVFWITVCKVTVAWTFQEGSSSWRDYSSQA